MNKSVSDIIKKFFMITNILSGVCFFTVMALVLVNIVMRNIFKMPIMGTVEIVGLMVATGLGFALANCEMLDGNIGMDIDLPWSRKIDKVIELTKYIISIIFWGIVVWQVFGYASASLVNGRVTPTASIPIYPFIFMLGINVLCLCLALVYKLVCTVKDFSAVFNNTNNREENT